MDKVHYSSESEEHYTPKAVLDAAVKVMGAIDLDPCADPLKRVPAAKHYTVEDDGLALPWQGRVFMNPPYGNVIKRWVHKAVRQHKLGLATEMITLTPSRTDTAWFQLLRNQLLCFVDGRLVFVNEDYQEAEHSAPFPSMLAYFGPNEDRFAEVFSEFGSVFRRFHVIP